MNEKALFIPLKTEWYEAFESGVKRAELRIYGNRWNERTCRIGRAVTLSKGYGVKNRIHGHVSNFEKVHESALPPKDHAALIKVFGTDDVWIARISVAKKDKS